MFTAFCESHASQVPFHAVARLLRVAFGVDDLHGQEALALNLLLANMILPRHAKLPIDGGERTAEV